MRVEDRFMKYISCATTSSEDANTTPSNPAEFELANLLAEELREIGLIDVQVTDKCYVYGCLPHTEGMEQVKSVGFISHMDTAPDFNGAHVRPQIIPDYDGQDVLLGGSGTYLKVSDFPDLKELTGKTLITTDGTSLLGADDKAGIAEIMTAVEQLSSGNIPHGDIRVCFTPDEEIGCGADYFDTEKFKADYAYTMDGDYEGEIAYENFNAASAVFTIHGVNVHPGEAKDIMVNAAQIACEIATLFPKEETPENTEGRQGFFHLTDMTGDVSEAKLHYIIRDHNRQKFESRKELPRIFEKLMKQKYGDEAVSLQITDQYENMYSVMEKHPEVIRVAEAAIRSAGMEPVSRPIRGGTDGARISFMGLPCPNLGTGGYGFHGPYEHITVEGMEKAVEIIRYICEHPLQE